LFFPSYGTVFLEKYIVQIAKKQDLSIINSVACLLKKSLFFWVLSFVHTVVTMNLNERPFLSCFVLGNQAIFQL